MQESCYNKTRDGEHLCTTSDQTALMYFMHIGMMRYKNMAYSTGALHSCCKGWFAG